MAFYVVYASISTFQCPGGVFVFILFWCVWICPVFEMHIFYQRVGVRYSFMKSILLNIQIMPSFEDPNTQMILFDQSGLSFANSPNLYQRKWLIKHVHHNRYFFAHLDRWSARLIYLLITMIGKNDIPSVYPFVEIQYQNPTSRICKWCLWPCW